MIYTSSEVLLLLKPKFLFFAVLLAGTAGGVAHGLMLGKVFDQNTGLAEPNHPLTFALFGLAAAAAVMSLFIRLESIPSTGGAALKPCVLLACVALGVSAVVDIVDLIGSTIILTQLVLAGLGLLSAAVVMLLVTSKNTQKLTLGLFATVPVFWACFWFLLVFAENSSNPAVLSFLFEFLAVLFTIAGCYMFAGFYFGLVKPRLLGVSISLGMFFTLASVISPAAVRLLSPETSIADGVTPSSVLRMVFALLYMAAIPQLAGDAMNMTEENPDGEETDNAENQAV